MKNSIILNSDMVKGILANKITELKIIIKPQPETFGKSYLYKDAICTPHGMVKEAPYRIDDIVLVKEAFYSNSSESVQYKADYDDKNSSIYKWTSPKKIPEEYIRLGLKIKSIEFIKTEKSSDMICKNQIDVCNLDNELYIWKIEFEKIILK